MRTKIFTLLIGVVVLLSVTACSGNGENTMSKSTNRKVVLQNDNTNEERNLLMAEDIAFFKQELPKRHKNPFSIITQKEFNDLTDQLIGKIDQMNNKKVFVELNKIIASIGDAHTSINIWDGYNYPLQFWIFDGKVYVVNADTSFEEMMFSQILKIDGVDIDSVIDQLTTLISHENESWVSAMLPNYLQAPVYMCGLGIVQNENEAVFTVEKDGEVKDFTVSALEYGNNPNFVNKNTKDILIGKYDKYYDYQYLPEHKAFYFEYNVCADMDNLKFADFNKEMFDSIEENDIEKIIIDLRSNSGGNSEILNPFTKRLKSYISKNPNVKVCTLVGRNTFSSGMFAIYRIKESAPEAISVGESTGGALDCYGEVKTINLPNSQIPISYSTKYFEFSKNFSYKNDGVGTFLPDVSIQPTINDYRNGADVVLDYVLAN
jgi:adenylate kinase